MASRVWQRLMNLVKPPEFNGLVWVFGIASGILLPVLLVLLGWLIHLLLVGQHGLGTPDVQPSMPEQLKVGRFFVLETSWLNAHGSVLRGVLGIVALFVLALILECICLLTSYRAALLNSLDVAVDLQRKLFEKSGKLAVDQGLSGQQEALQDMLHLHVPQVRESVSQWYRVFPRHLVQASLLLILAMSIHIWLTLLALICTLFLWMLYNNLDAVRRKKRPVQFERARAASEQLTYLCNTAPLLESVHDTEDTKHSYESHLNAYRAAQMQLADGGVWKAPLMLIACAAFAAMLLVITSIRFLDESTNLHFGEIVVMVISVALAIVGIYRFQRSFRKSKATEPAAEYIANYLEQPTSDRSDLKLASPERIQREIALDHVTIRDSTGQKLLEDISLAIKPGQITAIVSSNSVQASALAELIFGFGRPASGRILIDGVDSMDIDPAAVRRFSLWVAERGPLVHGSLEENLWSGTAPDATIDLMALARRVHVADAILNLPDGLATLVTPSEDRLQPDQLYRLGIARGLVKHRSLVIAQEPKTRVKNTTESETLDALLQLKDSATAIVILPQRLTTLRAADQIIVVHDHRIAGIGTHNHLLMESEIYRHLNYMQFAVPGQ